MKQFALLLGFLFFSSSMFADVHSRTLENFNQLRVSDGISVQLIKGNTNSANVSVSSGDESDVRTYIEDGILRIQWKKDINSYNRKANVELNYTQLNSIKANAGAKVRSTSVLASKELKLSAVAGSKIEIEVSCDNVLVECSSGATISLSGDTNSQLVETSSGAKYKSKDLVSETTEIEASTGATALVHVTSTIKAEASTGASIKYTGSPSNKEIEESIFTGGKVKAF